MVQKSFFIVLFSVLASGLLSTAHAGLDDRLQDFQSSPPVGSIFSSPEEFKTVVLAKGYDGLGAAIWLWVIPYKIKGTVVYWTTRFRDNSVREPLLYLQLGWYECDVRAKEVSHRPDDVEYAEILATKNCRLLGLYPSYQPPPPIEFE